MTVVHETYLSFPEDQLARHFAQVSGGGAPDRHTRYYRASVEAVRSLEVFDSERTLAAHWPGLLHAAALDALGRSPVRTSAALARSFAERVQRARLSGGIPAGLDRRFSGGSPGGRRPLARPHRPPLPPFPRRPE